jgi:hypothetical protein
MAKLESASDLAGKHVHSAAEIALAEGDQSAHRPIKLGTPDPYTPPELASR